MKRKKILIVDDYLVNRKVLEKLIPEDMEAVHAENGVEALALAKEFQSGISLILLDIIMPVMDGFEVLEQLSKDELLSSIPVIVQTSSNDSNDEVRCLSSGASDFISKPYVAEVVKHRIESIIRLRENASMINMLEYDQLTGLYSKEFFYKNVRSLFENYPNEDFDMICSDIENFKLINDKYGIKKGDEVLRALADAYSKCDAGVNIAGRLGSDKFGFVISSNHGFCMHKFNKSLSRFIENAPVPNLVLKFGVYRNVDKTLEIPNIYDRARLALERIKGKYGKNISVYDNSIREEILMEQNILEDMEKAIANREVMVYLQPKEDISSGYIIGAEALVRWKHPKFGMLSPGVFIPLFEKNGFISKLDYYVWEESCRMIKEWKEKGQGVVPISVNISRNDFYDEDLLDKLLLMTSKYNVEHKYLHVEVTESLYMDNPEELVKIVNQIRSMGFKIEMDDFGKGYSSLNMIGEMPIDVLKIDMSFIQNFTEEKKTIMGFIVALSRWLNLDTIVEGVETEEQKETVRRSGCNCIQGYYCSKPLPKAKFEEYVKGRPIGEPNISKRINLINDQPVFDDRHTILVVEDMEVSREIIREMLFTRYNIVEVNNGKEAWEYLQDNSHAVSVVLLDLMMPIMDGFRFLDMYKQDERFADIPVIITSEIEKDSEAKAIQLGAVSFVGKPYQKEILIHHIRNAIKTLEFATIKRSLEEQVDNYEEAAHKDHLTEILNRRGLTNAIKNLPKGKGVGHALLMLDIDNLKQCNDTYGHDFGDELIKKIANYLTSATRSDDIVARIGGDEFIVVLKFLADKDIAFAKGKRISDGIKAIELSKENIIASCSIGIAILEDPDEFEETWKWADSVLLDIKKTSKGQCVIAQNRN
ncbi:MAG: EAL domain-containing protein [Anaerovoracaceae bacterium]